MNTHSLNSLIRSILMAVAGALGLQSWNQNDLINAIVSAIILGITQWWSARDRKAIIEKTASDTAKLIKQ